ncbi:MAG: hypothetical protein M1825_002989 [Sarcosagium campestre]|nr:MAG: hypothetical protein M1825_002989 [Sarcosagium campestre]
MATAGASAMFLDLPLEIREQIYGGVLSDPSNRDVHLLRASQQIYAEAQPFLFKRPLVFESQFHLYEWIEQVSPQKLSYVRCVRMKLIDAVCSNVVTGVGGHRAAISAKISLKQMYDDDVARIGAALKALPGLQELTVYRQSVSEPPHVTNFHQAVFAVIAAQCLGLRSLTFYLDQFPLDFLSSLTDLRKLRFAGFSASSPQDTARILGDLRHLESLELFWPPRNNGTLRHPDFKGEDTTESVSPAVIRSLRPLRAFTVCESLLSVDEFTSIRSMPILRQELLLALRDVHAATLRSLRITTEYPLDSAALQALNSLLSAASSLHELTVGWPDLRQDTLHLLPASLRRLVIVVPRSIQPSYASAALLPLLDRMPRLTDATLIVEETDNWPTVNLDHVVAELRAAGLDADVAVSRPLRTDRLSYDADE